MKTNKPLYLCLYYCTILCLLIAEISAMSLWQFHVMYLTFCWLCICFFFKANPSVVALAAGATLVATATTSSFFSTDLLLMASSIGIFLYLLPPLLKIKIATVPLACFFYISTQALCSSIYQTPLFTASWFGITLACNVVLISAVTLYIAYITKTEVEI